MSNSPSSSFPSSALSSAWLSSASLSSASLSSSPVFASSPAVLVPSAGPEPAEPGETVPPDDESDAPDGPSCAHAMPGLFATASPIPNATASAPTLPMKPAYPAGVVAKEGSFRESPRGVSAVCSTVWRFSSLRSDFRSLRGWILPSKALVHVPSGT